MRWTIISIAVAIVLIVLGFWVWGSDNENIVQKAVYWFSVTGFLMAQGIHFMVHVRKHDL